MPNLDLSELITDPDFAQSFTVRRRSQTVNNSGVVVPGSNSLPVVGVIYPEDGGGLLSEPEQRNLPRMISVITSFRLQGPALNGDDMTLPDVVEWEGGDYLVQSVQSYAAFGAGFVRAVAASMKKTDPPIPEADDE